jgi:hypothetical protein
MHHAWLACVTLPSLYHITLASLYHIYHTKLTQLELAHKWASFVSDDTNLTSHSLMWQDKRQDTRAHIKTQDTRAHIALTNPTSCVLCQVLSHPSSCVLCHQYQMILISSHVTHVSDDTNLTHMHTHKTHTQDVSDDTNLKSCHTSIRWY